MNILRNSVLFIATLVTTQIPGGAAFAQACSLEQQLARHANQALRQSMQHKVSVTWRGQRLGVALDRLASAGQIALWLDRRVDRQQIINAQYVDLSLAQALGNLLEEQSLGVALFSDLVYVGPCQAAQELTILVDQARAMLSDVPAARRRRWHRSQPTKWPRLSEPRALAMDWLKTAHIELERSERIAHDLWPAQSLPSLPLVDRLVLLLAGFDLTCKISPSGKTCQVVPIQRPLKIADKRLAPPTPGRRVQQEIDRPGPKQPRQIERRKSRQRTSRQTFSLRLENQPLGQVLDQFAKQLQLEIVWPETTSSQSRTARNQLVSCDLQNVEFDELLRSVLASADLKYQRKNQRVLIEAK